MSGRVVGWFSCGDASAVACALALRNYRHEHVVIARIHLTSEHPDNERFTADCEKWYQMPIIKLTSNEYADTWDVWEKRKYIAGIQGAPCTNFLKKEVRRSFQKPDDIHVFGYTMEEKNRADRFTDNNPEINAVFPLIEEHLTKADCHALVRHQGIELPKMYQLGFDNNNCIGCPKGGAGYWNMIRKHFPDRFNRMAELSRRLNARLVKQDGKRIFLDELRATTGKQKDEIEISCSAFCDAVSNQIVSRKAK